MLANLLVSKINVDDFGLLPYDVDIICEWWNHALEIPDVPSNCRGHAMWSRLVRHHCLLNLLSKRKMPVPSDFSRGRSPPVLISPFVRFHGFLYRGVPPLPAWHLFVEESTSHRLRLTPRPRLVCPALAAFATGVICENALNLFFHQEHCFGIEKQ